MATPVRVLELRSVRGTGGGPEKTIMHGAARHDPGRVDVTVCYLRDQRDRIFKLDELAAEVGVAYEEVLERHSFDWRVWPALRRLVDERAIDVVHAHDYKTDLLALLLGRHTRARALATAHGWTGQSTRERWLYYPVDRKILTRFPHVIAVSSDIAGVLRRAGLPADRVTTLLNGIDATRFRADAARRREARRALGLEDADVVIGAVGRLERQKRFDLLIDACAPLLTARPELRLLIAGDGSLRASLESAAAARNLGSRCRLLGHRDDVLALYDAFDLLVQSSEYEGTPNIVLEGMAMETPLVATDVGGTRELAFPGEHAIVVPPHDVGALRAGIEAVLAAPEQARERAAAARRRVETDLAFAVRTRTLEEIYVKLAATDSVGQAGTEMDRA